MSNEYKDWIRDLREEFNAKTEQFDSLPDGWINTFVPQMKEELFEILGSCAENWILLDIKEKYGALRVYWSWNMERYDEIAADQEVLGRDIDCIIDKYSKMSLKTCAICGEPAMCVEDLPLCAKCYKKF